MGRVSIRSATVAYLTALVAATPGLQKVRVVPSPRDIGEISTPVLIVKVESLEKIPAAPKKLQANFIATLVSAHRDIDRAEDELDDLVELIAPALLTAGLVWQDATQVGYGDSNLAYDIRFTSILTPEV